MIITQLFLFDREFSEYSNLLKVAVNVFWIKTSIFSISSDSSSQVFKAHNDTMFKTNRSFENGE